MSPNSRTSVPQISFDDLVVAAREGVVSVPELLGLRAEDSDKICHGAEALLLKGSTQAAVDLLDWLVSAKPYVARYWLLLGVALQEQDRLGPAVRAYTACLALDAENVVAMVNRGECCLMLGATPRGVQDLEFAVASLGARQAHEVWIVRARSLLALHQSACERVD